MTIEFIDRHNNTVPSTLLSTPQNYRLYSTVKVLVLNEHIHSESEYWNYVFLSSGSLFLWSLQKFPVTVYNSYFSDSSTPDEAVHLTGNFHSVATVAAKYLSQRLLRSYGSAI